MSKKTGLTYEKETYDNEFKKCLHSIVDSFINKNKSEISQYAENNKLDIRDVEKQIKLHIPQFELSTIVNNNFLSHKIVPLLDIRFKNYKISFPNYLQKCGFEKIESSKELKIKGWDIVEKSTHKKIVGINVQKVNEQDARFIECELHYLRSFREDGVYRIGAFIENYNFPICYMSFCTIDRNDKEEALKKALQQQDFDSSKTIELSRVFGCGKLPKNTISFLVSQGTEYFRELGYEYMITAVNPYMGFTGISMLASNFIPFAVRPVQYQYAANGEYITIRSSENKKPCKMKMPSNILYLQEIQKTNKMQPIKFIHINEDDTIKQDIHKLRGSLENVWSDETRYHGTILRDNDHPSKGQCGVSSMYLAKHLQSEGYDVKFCEGNVFFEDGTSILNHCWIKLRKKNIDYIIDITADQNGYKQEVIFSKVQELKNRNIRYESTREIKNIDTVGVEHLITRLAHLENELINK